MTKRKFPSVFDYVHAADYLLAVLHEIQRTNPKYSLRSWSKKLRVSDSGSFSRILQKKRPVPANLANRLAELYEWTSGDLAYFQMLSAFPDGLDPLLARQLKVVLRRPQDLAAVHSVPSEQMTGGSSWLWPALFSLGHLESPPKDENEIVSRFPALDRNEVRAVLARMKQAGVWNEDNVVVFANEKMNIRRFHESMLTKAQELIHAVPTEKRHLGSTTIAVKKDDVSRLFEIVDRFHSEMMEIGRAGAAEEIYQFSTQFFPLLAGPPAEPS